MAKWLNVKLLIITVGVVLVVLGLVFWWGRTRVPSEPLPPLPKVEISPAVPQPEAPRYNLRASLPKVEKLPVYEYSFPERGSPSGWAQALGFSTEPQVIEDALEGILYLWSEDGQTLVINEDASSLSYRVDLKADPTVLAGSFLPTFREAATIVRRTLEELGEVSELLEHDVTKNKALKTGVSLVQETSLADAELVEVCFTTKIGGYPVYLESGPDWDPVLAWIGRDGKLLRLEYHSVGNLGEKIADYPLKNEEEVLEGLEGGEGTVVSSNLEGGQEIASVTITRVSLGYLLPSPNTAVIQPIYVLQGQARTDKGKFVQITIYLEAVRLSN